MGDASDYADVQRFLRSPEGQGHLDGLRKILQGKKINDVTFINETSGVGITLHFDNGLELDLSEFLAIHEVNNLRKRFGEVLDRERDIEFQR